MWGGCYSCNLHLCATRRAYQLHQRRQKEGEPTNPRDTLQHINHTLLTSVGRHCCEVYLEMESESEKQQQMNGVGLGFFQMPLHYPRYTVKDYLDMPEWKLDRLLAEYGLSANGDLDYKRRFAMGAFLWHDD
ncbi:hypothetical protein HRI_002386300 [Hibiscus trionum]|uniref:DUF7722 domain-containing protein n=1 Tax=Hibiscus trionum TaxID=183268 RepID=A0A9W7M678_HIBTR|nr:hypothetical protein HRI_002386300 [Hibiscus trionum]